VKVQTFAQYISEVCVNVYTNNREQEFETKKWTKTDC